MVACIHESLSLYLYENAQFLCERLVAAFPKQVTKGAVHFKNALHFSCGLCSQI